MSERSDTFEAEARVVLFGHDAQAARARIRRRARSWRLGGAARRLAASALIAPVAAVVPPHAPWAIGAILVGALLARRRWQERYTLESLSGACPRCGAPLSVRPARLREPHPVACDGCRHQVYVDVAAEALA